MARRISLFPERWFVTVVTSGGTSNAVTLNLVATLTFNPSNMRWGTTMALPKGMTGLRAVAVPGTSSTSAFAIVTGGFDGSANTTTVWSNNLNQDGTVGNTTNTTWTTIATNPLPTTLAHHAMAEADDTNSLVASGKRYIYVIGGQVNSTDAPGGTNTIYMASVDSTTGAVGTWTTLTKSLPQALVGESATVHNGYLYVAGGLAGGNECSHECGLLRAGEFRRHDWDVDNRHQRSANGKGVRRDVCFRRRNLLHRRRPE